MPPRSITTKPSTSPTNCSHDCERTEWMLGVRCSTAQSSRQIAQTHPRTRDNRFWNVNSDTNWLAGDSSQQASHRPMNRSRSQIAQGRIGIREQRASYWVDLLGDFDLQLVNILDIIAYKAI